MRVFISHASADRARCKDVVRALTKARLRPWTHEEIVVGKELAKSLRGAIEGSSACVFIATARSVESQWCQAETGAFWGADKPVLVFKADDTLREKQIPALFRGHKWTTSMSELVGSLGQVRMNMAPIPLGMRPANIFWLAHDLTSAIHASYQGSDQAEFSESLLQAIHHLDETGLLAPAERKRLLGAWRLAKRGSLSDSLRNRITKEITVARNDIANKLAELQRPYGGFAGYPSHEAKERILQEARPKPRAKRSDQRLGR